MQSERLLVRPSPDGRLLLTGGGGSGIFLATFDPVLGIGTEVSLAGMAATGFGEAAFSPDSRTLVLHDNFCWGSLLGPPFCETYLIVYDISDPASPVGTGALSPRLYTVNDWLFLLQPGVPGLEAIRASSFDAVVIDYSLDGGAAAGLTAAQVGSLKASGKVVLAYLSIGEAEDYRRNGFESGNTGAWSQTLP